MVHGVVHGGVHGVVQLDDFKYADFVLVMQIAGLTIGTTRSNGFRWLCMTSPVWGRRV